MPGCLFEQLLHLWPRRELENQIACTDSRDVIVHLGTTVLDAVGNTLVVIARVCRV